VGAVRAIAALTLLVTLASGALIHILDGREFPTLGSGLWWAAQTVTTVGYGDVVPEATAGRLVAVYVMLTGIGFLMVATAAISARLIDGTRRRSSAGDESLVVARLDEIAVRLERLEATMRDRRAA
jgi:voltage-gated potassium channel